MYYFDIARKEVLKDGIFYCAFSSANIEMSDTIQQARDKMRGHNMFEGVI